MLGVDLDNARLYHNEELLDLLAGRQDFGQWVKKIQKIGSLVRDDVVEPVIPAGRAASASAVCRQHA